MINFGEWIPDQPALNNSGASVAKNCFPSARGYRQIKGLSDFSNAADARLRGMRAAKSNDQNITILCGDGTKLYKYNQSNNNLENVSKSGNYSLGIEDRWDFVQFGSDIIAVGGTDVALQRWTLDSSSLFADLAGTAPAARHVAVVRDFVMTGFTKESGTTYPYRVRWCGLADITTWGSSTTTQADFQDQFGIGYVTGLVGGETVTIFCERGIIRGTYVGSPLIFQFDVVESSRGCSVSGSIVNVGSNAFYWSDDGIYVFDGEKSIPIGAEKVNRWLIDNFDAGLEERVYGAADPLKQVIVWTFPSKTGSGTADRLLIYNYALNQFSYAEVATDLVDPLFTAGYTLEQMATVNSSIDAIGTSFDDDIWKGGSFFFAGSIDNKISSFAGSTQTAIIETPEISLSPNKFTMLNEVRPYVEMGSGGDGATTVQIGTRKRTQDSVVYSSATSINDEGIAPVRSNARFHTIRLNLSGDWDHALGVDLVGMANGVR